MNNLFNELDKLDLTSILVEEEEIDLNSIEETKIVDDTKSADDANVEAVAKEFSDAMAISGVSDVKSYTVEQATELTESIIDRLNLKGGSKLVESVLTHIGLKESNSAIDVANLDQAAQDKEAIKKVKEIVGNRKEMDPTEFMDARRAVSDLIYDMKDMGEGVYALVRGYKGEQPHIVKSWTRKEEERLHEKTEVSVDGENVTVNTDDASVNVNGDAVNVVAGAEDAVAVDLPVEEPIEEPVEEPIEEPAEVQEEVLADPEENEGLEESVDWGYYDRFNEILDKYMPASGEGESMASQIVTAINKLVYKWYNDGDVYDNTNPAGLTGWANDLSSYANWLAENVDGAKEILDRIYDINYGGDSEYEDLLKDLADSYLTSEFLGTCENHPKEGSIYNCDGAYEWDESNNDDEEDYYESEKTEEGSESLKETESFEGTKADIMKKHPELAYNPNYLSYADDDWMAVDYNEDGTIKGLRLATKVTEAVEETSIKDILNCVYDIISNNAESLCFVDGANLYLTDNSIFLEDNSNEKMYEIVIKEAEKVDNDEEVEEVVEDGFQVDNVPAKNDQGRRIELAKLENEGNVTYRVSYLNESDEEIVGWDIEAADDEEAVSKLDQFADADVIADEILGLEFQDSGVEGVSSLFHNGANISLAADEESYVITIDKDGEDPVILNGQTTNDVMAQLVLWYVMNTENGVETFDDIEDKVEDVLDPEPAADLEEAEAYSVTANIADDMLDEISDFNEDDGTYALKGEYSSLSFIPDDEAPIGNYDDEQPFIISGDKALVDKFVGEYASIHESELTEGEVTTIEVELPYDLLEEITEFNENTNEYTLTGNYADLKLVHIEEPRESNFDDTEFFTLEGDSDKISAFLDEFDLRDNI